MATSGGMGKSGTGAAYLSRLMPGQRRRGQDRAPRPGDGTEWAQPGGLVWESQRRPRRGGGGGAPRPRPGGGGGGARRGWSGGVDRGRVVRVSHVVVGERVGQ